MDRQEYTRFGDPWVRYATALGAHLESRHQGLLCALAARFAGDRDVDAVCVRDLGPDRLHLRCLAPDGVTALALSFNPPVAHPREFGSRLLRATIGQPVHSGLIPEVDL